MRAGLGSYAFRYAIGAKYVPSDRRMNFADLINYCNDHFIPVLQVCDNVPLHLYTQAEIRQCLELSLKYGIEMEVGTKGISYNHMKQYLEISGYLKAKILRTILSNEKINKREELIDQIRNIIPLLESKNITLAIENHFKYNPEELSSIIEEINHPLVRICIDPLNSLTLFWGENETFEQLKKHIVNAHIKDAIVVRKGTGFVISGCELGKGMAGVRKYLDRIYKINPCCNVILEQWMDEEDNISKTLEKEKDWVKDGMEYLKKVIEQVESKKMIAK